MTIFKQRDEYDLVGALRALIQATGPGSDESVQDARREAIKLMIAHDLEPGVETDEQVAS